MELSLIKEFGKGHKIDFHVGNDKQIKIAQLSVNEINNALEFWIIASQKQSFPVEYEAVVKKKEIPKSSRLRMLTPWMDEFGLLRITGRLANSELSLSQKKPIILDYKCDLPKDWLLRHIKSCCMEGYKCAHRTCDRNTGFCNVANCCAARYTLV